MAVLYSFRRCPYAMRARMALYASGVEYEHREIILRDKPASMLAASPKGTVPVFIKDDSSVIDESLDLALWALSQNDPKTWLAAFEPDLTARNDGEFKHHLDRYKYASRYDENLPRGAVDLGHREQAESFLIELETRLSKTAYLSGDTQSLTDITIFPFLRQFAAVEPEWWAVHDYPRVREWLKTHVESELFKTIMKKHPLWDESGAN
ncbi:MAG: glutathione S-transferase [Maricaulaceae bacterium]